MVINEIKITALIKKEEGGLFDYLQIREEFDDRFIQELSFKAEIPTLHDFQNIYYLLTHSEFEANDLI